MTTWLVPIVNGFVLISDEDRHLLTYKWSIVSTDGTKQYVRANINGKNTYLHRLIMNAGPGEEVDHINGDSLDNSRPNLRIATRSQNSANRRGYRPKSGYRGVYAQPHGSTWQVKISVNGHFIRGGNFKCPVEAAHRYDELARQHFGKFASLNFPTENTQ